MIAAASAGCRFLGLFGAVWGLGGVLALLGFAVYRLAPVSLAAFDHPFDWRHWSLHVVHTVFMGYAEGHREFHRSYSPRLAARARHLQARPGLLALALAPPFCMGCFHTTRRRLVSAHVLTVMIVALILVFQSLAQPWRGLLDAGVVFGLAWGIASIAVVAWRTFVRGGLDASPELPDAAERGTP